MRRRDFLHTFLRGAAALPVSVAVGTAAGSAGSTVGSTAGSTAGSTECSTECNTAGSVAPAALTPAATRAPRVAVLDWGLVETLLAVGVVPVGVAETGAYNDSVVEPRVPARVTDLGLRLAPSLELLQQLAPDLILINSSQESQRAMLERIAPVRAFAVYTDAGAPYRHSRDVTLELARLCGRVSAGQALLDATERTLADCRARVAAARATSATSATSAAARPVYLFRFFDGRHIGVYGARSLFQHVMDALDVANAWHGPTDYWGIGVAGIEALAATPAASLVYFDPLPAGMDRTLAANRLWHALPAVADGRVMVLPPFWGFGMLPSAARFARALADALSVGAASSFPASQLAPTHPQSSTLRAQQEVR